MTLRVEIITDPRRFAQIAQAWQQLWADAAAHIFQHHDWISGWITGVHDRREIKLLVALAWDDNRLVAAMPCAVHRRSGLRVLTWAAQLFSDYCDCLLNPAYGHTDVLPMLWNGLHRHGGFDLINMQQVRPDAQCREFLDQLAREGGGLHHADREERCMRIENLWPHGDAFFRSLNKKGRNNHTRGKRILAELGQEPRFRIIDGNQPVAPVLDEILRLKNIWLRATEPSSTLLGADAIVLRSILDRACKTGLARIFLLECGDRIAAASVNFIYHGRMEAYLTSYDAAFERASPGTILIVDYAKWSFDRGLALVDFLRGEEAFKFRMANAETVLSSFAGARTMLGQFAVSGHRWLSRRRQRQDVTADQRQEQLEAAD